MSTESDDGGRGLPPSRSRVMHFRRYEAGDAGATWEVFHAAVRFTALVAYDQGQVAAWSPEHVDAERWARRRAAAWTLVAVEGAAVIGFADLTDSGELDMLFVHPDHGRRGVATALVAAIVEEVGCRGTKRIEVRASRVLQPLLERLGFVLDRDVPDNRLGDQVLANARLHLDVAPPPSGRG